jgi:transposase
MTVNNWVASFERHGIEGLKTKAGQGRKPILTDQHESMVRKAVQEERQRLSQAQKIIEENMGRSMSRATLTRFLKVITGVTNE